MKQKKVLQPKVAIIVLTYNQKKLLEETLQSVVDKTDYKNYKIFLVDNGSVDRHDLMVKKKFPKVVIIRNDKNLGYSKGNNIGIEYAKEHYNPDYYVLLNDDIEITQKDWLKKMIGLAEKSRWIGIVGTQSIYPDGAFQNVGGYLKGWELTKILNFKKDKLLFVDHFDVVCMLVKKDVMDKLKGMDEIYTPYLLEDSDFCLRCRRLGYQIVIDPSIKVIHKKSKTITAMNNPYTLLIRFKNDIIFSRRHLKGWNKLFRLFIFLPMVALFEKKNDNDKLQFKNFRLRKDCLRNLYYYLIAFNQKIYKPLLRKGGIEI